MPEKQPFPDSGWIDAALIAYRRFIERIDVICRDVMIQAGNAITCHEGCDMCCEAIGVWPVEAIHIARHTEPLHASTLEALLWNTEVHSPISEKRCWFLENHRCRIYPVRPLICRTQGMAFLVEEAGEKRLVHCPNNFRHMSHFPAKLLIDLDRMNEILIGINLRFLHECGLDSLAAKRIPLNALIPPNRSG